MTLEAIFVSTLLLTHLAKPAQLLQPLGLDSVRYLQIPSRSAFARQSHACSNRALVSEPIVACYRPVKQCHTFFIGNAEQTPRKTYRLGGEEIILPHALQNAKCVTQGNRKCVFCWIKRTRQLVRFGLQAEARKLAPQSFVLGPMESNVW